MSKLTETNVRGLLELLRQKGLRPNIIGSIATKGYSDELLNIVFIQELSTANAKQSSAQNESTHSIQGSENATSRLTQKSRRNSKPSELSL